MAGDLFAGHVLVFLFCVSTKRLQRLQWRPEEAAANPVVADDAAAPQRAATHLVTCLLVNLPHLSSPITLLICSV